MVRRNAYQYYTNVNYRTCASCLSWHGVIRRRADEFPAPVDGCASAILRIPAGQLRAYKRKAKRMQLRAREELQRRELFERAGQLLTQQYEAALALFERASRIDVYVPEIEALAEAHREFLVAHPEVRDRLRAHFVKAYSEKFGWRRYERLPEVMRLQREQAGKRRINEVLG